MKMAKPSEADFENTVDFLNACDSVLGAQVDPETGDELEGSEAQLSVLERYWRDATNRWSRVLWAGKTAIDNCCDPNARVLEHKPEIAKAIAMQAANVDLLAACKDAQCDCTIRERDSGHKVGCWFPAMQAAIARAEPTP